MKRESDRKCVNHARVHASAQSFDCCEGQRSRFLVLTQRSAASWDENARALEWFRVMRPLGAFVLVFLQAQIKSTCISLNTFCIFSMKQCTMKH